MRFFINDFRIPCWKYKREFFPLYPWQLWFVWMVNAVLVAHIRINRTISLKNKRPTWCHLLFYFTSYVLIMFRTLIYPSSGACDYSVELPHSSYCSWCDVCWSFGVVGLEWYPCCRLQYEYHSNPTTPKLQRTSNQEQYDQCGNLTE